MPEYDYHRIIRHTGERRNATWRVDQAVREKVTALALDHNVGTSDLVNYLLSVALCQVEEGELEIPIRPAALNRIDWP